jgi:small subunit ribosomal protein S18
MPRPKRKPVDEKVKKRVFMRRKVCRFCADTAVRANYKEAGLLRHFISERGKMIPRRITGNCARHQREVATAIRQARMIALMPFAVTGK